MGNSIALSTISRAIFLSVRIFWSKLMASQKFDASLCAFSMIPQLVGRSNLLLLQHFPHMISLQPADAIFHFKLLIIRGNHIGSQSQQSHG